MMWESSLSLNLGIKALFNSPDATMLPMASQEHLNRWPSLWKTLAYQLSSARWSWWKAERKSNLENTLFPANFIFCLLLFWNWNICVLYGFIDFSISTVNLMLLLSLGASTTLEIQITGHYAIQLCSGFPFAWSHCWTTFEDSMVLFLGVLQLVSC